MEQHEYTPVQAFRLNLTIYTYLGLWPVGLKNKSFRYIYAVYMILGPGFFFALFFLLQLINVFILFPDMEKIMDASYLLVTYFAICAKILCFLVHRKRIEKLFDILNEPLFIPRLSKHYKFMSEAMRIVNRDSNFFFYSGMSATLFWTFYPLIDSSTRRQLAYTMWTPIDVSESPIFELVYTYQVAAITYNTMFNTMTDTLINGLLRMMSGHLEILAEDYKSILNDIFVCPGENQLNAGGDDKTKDGDGDDEAVNEKQSKNNEIFLTKQTIDVRVSTCVEYALAIERYAIEVNDIFGKGIFTQFVASCGIICASAYALTMIPLMSVQFVSVTQYLGCMILQIFIYCWRGNELTTKFSDLSDAIYSCEWVTKNNNFTKTMNVIMGRLQKPVTLVVGGLFSLSVDTFIAITKSAYSFFMFLKEVQASSN